jgi:hypothetical protein
MKIDKKDVYTAVESKFPDPTYSAEINNLTSHCLKLSDEWLSIEENITSKSRRELRKDLKQYIMTKTNLRDSSKSYFIPSFIWVFLAGQIISWIVRYIIEKYTNSPE